MIVKLDKVRKRFEHEWVIKDLTFTFTSGKAYAILGPNGSGKSTLMQLISGAVSPSVGTISYSLDNKNIPVENIFRQVSYSGPYIQLVEEMTLKEHIHFHKQFKPFRQNLQESDILALTGLSHHADRQVRNFSSGMKQRVKLALSILSDTYILLLDEPATNLDDAGLNWYLNLLTEHRTGRLVIVSSNRPEEYSFCDEQLSILDYK
jgi:ABC-type multidrug transport system ATPase subunit